MAKKDNENLVLITFEGEHTAEGMLATLRELEQREAIKLDDAVVISRAPNTESIYVAGTGILSNQVSSEAEVKQTTDKKGRRMLKTGGIGLIVGTLLGGPVGGLLLGGLIGALRDTGIDNKFVEQIKDGIKPDSSAIMLLVESGDTEQVLETIRPLKGTVLHTTLSPELDKKLRDALRHEE